MSNLPREEALFTQALALPAAARAAFLLEACPDEPALRQHVEALLREHEASEGALDAPPPRVSAGLTRALRNRIPIEDLAGTKIGRYKLLQKLGEGGCGVVFMAQQEEPVRRRVALKVIKLGMDTNEVIARFEAERQALALMDHPNIARVLDAGATEVGRPYFVMDLVRGIPITQHCDENNLGTAARLKLFAQVCHAVQHAHQKGIIHRDLKPTNILVTLHDGVPVPKIIDFGIAKATQGRLTDKTLFTAFDQFIGTPAYMSPEQTEMSGLDVDTRSDIYSLGVLLYELLTGRTPFEAQELLKSGLDEMRRTIREKEPLKPSARVSTLDAVTTETVARQRSTESARLPAGLRGDLDCIVMCCLEKDRGRRYDTASSLANDVLRHLNDEPVVARPPSAGYRLQKMVRRNKLAVGAGAAITVVCAVATLVSVDQAIRATDAKRIAQSERSAAVEERTRAVQARDEAENARLREAAQRTKAEADERKAVNEAARSAQFARLMKSMLEGVGPFVARGRDTKLMRDILDATAARIGKDLAGQPEIEVELREILGRAYYDIGDFQSAVAAFRQTLEQRLRLAGDDGTAEVATAHFNLGRALLDLRRPAEAEPRFREAIALQQNIPGFQVTLTMSWLCRALEEQKKLAESEALWREVLAIEQGRWGDEHLVAASAQSFLGMFLHRVGKLDEAEDHIRTALAIRRRLAGDDSAAVANSLSNLGGILRAQNHLPEAETVVRELVALRRKHGPEEPFFYSALNILGATLAARNKFPEAIEAYVESVAVTRKFWGNDHRQLATNLTALGSTLLKAGELREAQTKLRESLTILRSKNLEGDLPLPLQTLGSALERDGKLTDAEECFREALAVKTRLLGDDHPDLIPNLGYLSNFFKRQGKLDDAAPIDRRIETLRNKRRRRRNDRQKKSKRASKKGSTGRAGPLGAPRFTSG